MKGGGGNGGTQTNIISIFTSVDGIMRDAEAVTRTMVHELGHSGGLSHPWEVQENTPEADIKQGSYGVLDNTVKTNIMNSAENPNINNGIKGDNGSSSMSSTPGQLKQINQAINEDTSTP
ncbi:MAG: hypothetical protein KF732_07125 [Flavobacteriales bacterium]|nr:hypothetical protein [Flavobacteriales bacterium]MBX2959716.1 hypothetical protein [Flavobacteriales bacterium]